MKKSLRIVLLLCVCILALCLFCTARDAIAPQNDDQLAVVETARAFVDKGVCVQYDSTAMTIQEKNPSGVSRLTSGMPIDHASADNILYSVCSDFCYDVYKYVFNYDVMGTPRESRTKVMTSLRKDASNGLIAFKFDGTGADDSADYVGKANLDAAVQAAWEQMQPGDIIVGYGYKNYDPASPTSGHAMLFVGNYKNDGKDYIIHCNGSKIDMSTGIDKVEGSGAIAIIPAYDACFNKNIGGTWNLYNATRGGVFVIMRPLNVIHAAPSTYPMTEAGKTRLTYSRLSVDRTTNKWRYNTVRTGETITVSVKVSNYSTKNDAIGITVTENLPEGATLVGAPESGGVVDGNTIRWTIDLGKKVDNKLLSKTLRYQLKITAPAGSTLDLPGGTVAGLTTRPLSYRVGEAALTDAQKAKLTAVANGSTVLSLTSTQGAFANDFYEQVLGIKLHLPDKVSEWMNTFLELIPVRDAGYGGKMWRPKDRASLSPENQITYDMIIPEHLTGFAVYLGSDPQGVPFTMNADGRVRIFQENAYEPGDIFIALCDPDVIQQTSDKNTETFIYLGNGKVAAAGTGGMKIVSFDESILLMLRHNILFGLRPTQAAVFYNTPIGPVTAGCRVNGKHTVFVVDPESNKANTLTAAWRADDQLIAVQHKSAEAGTVFQSNENSDALNIYALDTALAPVSDYARIALEGGILPAPAPAYPSSLTLNQHTATLYVNNTYQLKATISPSNAKNQQITWTSSDPAVVSVSDTGLVTALKVGNAPVTITADCCGVVSDTCTFTVTRNNETPRIPIK